jgi:hypothetical protein
MYSLKAILEKEPAVLAEAVRAILLTLVLFNVIVVNEQQLATAMLALSALLTLFVRQVSTPTAAPILAEGAEVTVKGTTDTVIVAPTPPGPIGIEGNGP